MSILSSAASAPGKSRVNSREVILTAEAVPTANVTEDLSVDLKTIQTCDLGQAAKITVDKNTTVVEAVRR
jgi:hypothetical protein